MRSFGCCNVRNTATSHVTVSVASMAVLSPWLSRWLSILPPPPLGAWGCLAARS